MGATLAVLLFATNVAAAGVVRVGVSNPVYADLARQIGRQAVTVSLFQHPIVPLPKLDIIICGCSGSDAWLADAAQREKQAFVIKVSNHSAAHRADIEPPWYDVRGMARLAEALAAELTRRAPAETEHIASNTRRAMAGFFALDRRIDEVSKAYANADVLLADELSRGMIERLRFKIRDEDYLKSLKSGTSPSAKATSLKKAIQQWTGSIFLYDKDAANPTVKEIVGLANDSGIPVVALHKQPPKGLHYQQWMLRQMNAVHGALNEASP